MVQVNSAAAGSEAAEASDAARPEASGSSAASSTSADEPEAAAALVPITLILIRARAKRPGASVARPAAEPLRARLGFLARSPVFHALFWSYVVCGFTTTGVIETHLLPYAAACGFPPLQGATAYGVLSDKQGARVFRIERARATPKGVIAHLAGVSDRTGAEALKGAELYVERDRLPPPADGEFYHADLIGLAAFDPDGAPAGEIVAVVNYGAGDLLEVRFPGASTSEFVPFTEDCVPTVDIAAGRVVIVLPSAAGEEPG